MKIRSQIKKLLKIVLVPFICFSLLACTTTITSAPSVSLFVNSSGYGATRNSALQDAFKNAVQQASGVFLISSSRLENEVLTRDITNEYSTGIISRYEILSESRDGNGAYKLQIGALVSSNKLLSYIATAHKPSNQNPADGTQIYAYLSTTLKSKDQGDRLVASLATQFPYPAISIQLGTLSPQVDANRQVHLLVPYQLQWNKEYLESLRETVDYISTYKCSVINSVNNRCTYDVVFSNGFWSFGARTGYTLTDKVQLELLRQRLNPNAGIQLVFYDKNGLALNTACADIDLATNWGQSISMSGSLSPSHMPLVYFTGSALEINELKINGTLDLNAGDIDWTNKIAKMYARLIHSCRG